MPCALLFVCLLFMRRRRSPGPGTGMFLNMPIRTPIMVTRTRSCGSSEGEGAGEGSPRRGEVAEGERHGKEMFKSLHVWEKMQKIKEEEETDKYVHARELLEREVLEVTSVIMCQGGVLQVPPRTGNSRPLPIRVLFRGEAGIGV